MEKEKDDFSKDVESILKKTININKQYLKQGTELVKEFGNSGKNTKNLNLFQPQNLLSAFTQFTKMNLDHYKNMMDLSFEISKKAFQSAESEQNDDENPEESPSFVISATVNPGESVSLEFLLDNVKTEEVTCQLVNSEYINSEEPGNGYNFKTVFQPQSFQLEPSASQTVKIRISVEKEIVLGTYQSKVQVVGFEPAYFLIQLNITQKQAEEPKNKQTKKPAGNGRRKKQ